jgi:hypothetical protein
VFPVRYELNFYILFIRNSVSKELIMTIFRMYISFEELLVEVTHRLDLS